MALYNGVGPHIERLWPSLDEHGPNTIPVTRASNFHGLQRQVHCRREALSLVELWLVAWSPRIPDNRDPADRWHGFLEELELLGRMLQRRLDAEPGEIAARPPQACDEPGAHGIEHRRGHDRDGRGRGLRSRDHLNAPGHDDVGLERDQLGCERGKAVGVPFREAIFHDEGLSLAVAQLF